MWSLQKYKCKPILWKLSESSELKLRLKLLQFLQHGCGCRGRVRGYPEEPPDLHPLHWCELCEFSISISFNLFIWFSVKEGTIYPYPLMLIYQCLVSVCYWCKILICQKVQEREGNTLLLSPWGPSTNILCCLAFFFFRDRILPPAVWNLSSMTYLLMHV